MQGVAILLLLLCFVFLILGLIKPSFVIRWGKEEHKTRKAVLGVFFFAFVFAVIVGAVTGKPAEKNDNVATNAGTGDITDWKKDYDTRDRNGEVIKNQDGSTTVWGVDGDSVTSFPDETTISVKGVDIIKETGKYKSLEVSKNTTGMNKTELSKVVGKKLMDKLSDDRYQYKEFDRVVQIAKKHGFNHTNITMPKFQLLDIYRAKDSNLQNFEWKVTFINDTEDISKSNPDAIAEKNTFILREMIKEMPEYAKIELLVSSKRGRKEDVVFSDYTEYDGELINVSVCYYKDINAITKLIIRRHIEKGKSMGVYKIYDIMQ